MILFYLNVLSDKSISGWSTLDFFNPILQVYDLNLLRDSDGFQEVEATATFEEFGNAHNIVANEDTDFVYVVGATQNYPGVTCLGEKY